MQNLFVTNASDKVRSVFPQLRNNNKNKLNGKAGSIISALITKKENGKAVLQTKDKVMLEFAEESVKGNVGDEVFFEMTSSNEKEITLKQINKPFEKIRKHIEKHVDLDSLKELMKKNDFIAPEENILAPKNILEMNSGADAKISEAVKKIKRELAYASGNVSQAAITELLSKGISIDKVSIKILNTVIKDVSENKNAAPEPDTSEDVAEIQNKLSDISELSDETIAQALKSEKDLTIENIYVAKYSSAGHKEVMDRATSEKLMPEIRKIMRREGIDATKENIDLSKFFVRNEIPINKENIEKAKFLKNMGSYIDNNDVLKAALDIRRGGDNPSDFVLYQADGIKNYNSNDETDYKELIDDISQITPEHIEIALKQNDRITIKNLLDLLKNNIPQKNKDKELRIDSDFEIKAATAKRQMAEIQLKLTSEAAVRLADKNIKIETATLQETVKYLREFENEKYTEILKASQAEPTEENKSKMIDLFNHIKNLMPVHHAVAPAVIENKIRFTIEGVSAANTQLASYEQFATKPNAKYGDSFDKISEQIVPVLEKLAISANEDNIRAAEILIKNNMEINEENLADINMINGKISEIYERLNPFIAADMIKSGLNPSEMHIDEVISYIEEYNEKYGDSALDTIAKNIKKLDDTKELSKQERDSVISIYRMLNQIQKDGGAAIGSAYKADSSMTLGNLMEASKYMQKTKGTQETVNKTVDDNNGEAYAADSEDLPIKEILSKTAYTVRHFGNYSDIETVKSFVKNNTDIGNMDIESALIELRKLHREKISDASAANEYSQRIRSCSDVSHNIIKTIEENGIPLTLTNIEILENYLSDKKYFSREVNKLRSLLEYKGIENNIDKNFTDTRLSSLNEESLKINEDLNKDFIEELENIISSSDDAEIISQADIIRRTANVMSMIRPQKDVINTRISFSGKITDIDMYVMNKNMAADKADIFISLDAGSLGEVQILMKTNEYGADLTIATENEGIEKLQNNEIILLELVKKAGYKPGSIKYKCLDSKNINMSRYKAAGENQFAIYNERILL